MFATVVGGSAGAAVVAAALQTRPAAVAFVFLAAVSPGLAVIDAVAHRLPFIVTGTLGAGLAASFGWDAVWSGGRGSLERAVWAALVVGVLALIWWRVFGGGAGLGDVALLAVISGYLGWWSWTAVWVGISLGFVLAALAVGVARWRVRRPGEYMPLGPWLLGGCWVAIAINIPRS
jgi:leader peptidase (prepilin peptidase)/N-methyltransferase